MPALNEEQLRLFTQYVSRTVQNNQEIHPSDMPPVITMIQLLADRGLWITGEQMETVCDSLHSLANRDVETSPELREYLRHVASAFEFEIRHRERGEQMWRRPYNLIAGDIISERDIDYSETT